MPLDWTEAGAWAVSSVTRRWRAITRKAEAPLDWTEAGAWTVSSVTRRWRAITRTGGWRSQVTMKLGPEQKERTERRKKRWRKGRRREQLSVTMRISLASVTRSVDSIDADTYLLGTTSCHIKGEMKGT